MDLSIPWSPEMREKCIAFALKTGRYSAVRRKYGVPEATVRGWVQGRVKDVENLRDLRTLARARAIEDAWRALSQGITDVLDRFDRGADMTDEEAIQAVERLSRAINNLGDVSQKIEHTVTVRDDRKAAAAELEEFESKVMDADFRVLPPGRGDENESG